MKGLAFLAVGALMYALFLTSGVQGSHKALDIKRPGRRGQKLSVGRFGLEHRRPGAGWFAASCRFYV